MAFQDFDQISERRRLERQGKFRKRVTIAVVVTALLLALIGVGLFFLVTKLKHDRKPKPSPSQSPATTQTQYIVNGEKLVKIMCSRTEYKEKCEKTLRDSLGSVPRQSTPKDLLTIAMSATLTDFETAFKKINTTFETDTPQEKAAFEDCKVLFRDAKEEMEYSIRYLRNNNLDNFSTRSFELQILLSAVMSYLQTCIDGIPEGKLKSNTEKALQDSKEFTSNSLALVLDVASFLSSFQNPTGGDPHRHLLGRQISSETDRYSNYEFPSWMDHEDRRMLKANDDKPTPNVTVAKDGSGNFSRISDALATMPPKYEGRYVIYVKEGVYDETVIVTKIKVNVTMYGDGSQKSIITGSKNFVDGASTLQTATFAALGDGFIGKSMGFRNTAGLEKHEAVAARVQADRSIFVNCRFEGYQKTLYVQTHRQFYRACVITGTVDFIFGDAAAVFQQCNIFLRKPLENQQNTIIAQGRIDRHETTGIVLQKCQIRPDDALVPVKTQIKSYLGRPWKEYSRAIVMESTIEDIIQPEGWVAWQGDFALDTLYFGEYANKGDGAKLGERVKWSGYKGAIDKQEAIKFTVGTFLRGKWISDATIPVRLDLYAN